MAGHHQSRAVAGTPPLHGYQRWLEGETRLTRVVSSSPYVEVQASVVCDIAQRYSCKLGWLLTVPKIGENRVESGILHLRRVLKLSASRAPLL